MDMQAFEDRAAKAEGLLEVLRARVQSLRGLREKEEIAKLNTENDRLRKEIDTAKQELSDAETKNGKGWHHAPATPSCLVHVRACSCGGRGPALPPCSWHSAVSLLTPMHIFASRKESAELGIPKSSSQGARVSASPRVPSVALILLGSVFLSLAAADAFAVQVALPGQPGYKAPTPKAVSDEPSKAVEVSPAKAAPAKAAEGSGGTDAPKKEKGKKWVKEKKVRVASLPPSVSASHLTHALANTPSLTRQPGWAAIWREPCAVPIHHCPRPSILGTGRPAFGRWWQKGKACVASNTNLKH